MPDIVHQEIIERLSRHCPESLTIYLQCVNRSDKKGYVFFSRDVVEINMSESWVRFKNNIKKLAKENILEWHPFNKGIAVTLADFDRENRLGK